MSKVNDKTFEHKLKELCMKHPGEAVMVTNKTIAKTGFRGLEFIIQPSVRKAYEVHRRTTPKGLLVWLEIRGGVRERPVVATL